MGRGRGRGDEARWGAVRWDTWMDWDLGDSLVWEGVPAQGGGVDRDVLEML